jgi:hypothetical protein
MPFCNACGTKISDDARSCHACGKAVPQAVIQSPSYQKGRATLPDEIVRSVSEAVDKVFAPGVQVGAAGGQALTVTNLDIGEAFAFVEMIDGHLKEYPDNVDLLLAKSSALRCAMQWKSAEEIIDKILRRDPNQFDARLIKDEWDTWPHLLQCPPFRVGMTKMPSALSQVSSRDRVVLVRDGLSLRVALIQDASQLQFARELTPEMRCKWEFVSSDTPYGRIVAHYCFVEDAPNCSYLRESILQTGRPQRADGVSGYWLLQRLARTPSALFVLVNGDRVAYSNRYVFPEAARARIRKIAEVIAEDPKPAASQDDFRSAIKWHTDHFDDRGMTFDA